MNSLERKVGITIFKPSRLQYLPPKCLIPLWKTGWGEDYNHTIGKLLLSEMLRISMCQRSTTLRNMDGQQFDLPFSAQAHCSFKKNAASNTFILELTAASSNSQK
jgi:hypothetical protein